MAQLSATLLAAAAACFTVLVWMVLVVVLLRNLIALAQLVLAIRTFSREAAPNQDFAHLWARNEGHAPKVSVIAPAYNEELSIAASIRSLLALRYHDLELVVVNDGSRDRTMTVLIEAFELEAIDRRPLVALHRTRIVQCYRSRRYENLFVVDKENGRKADAVNAGISFAEGELICVIDADSVIDPEGLLRAVEPFMADDGALIAVGGSIRVANGCAVSDGHIERVGVSKAWLPRFQTIEYFRAFLAARAAFARLSLLLLISGAFGVFRRDALVAAGGYKHDTVGEDLEVLVRMQRLMCEQGRPYRVAFLPEVCCWTEVPTTIAGLRNQRTRWQQGAIETLLTHRTMLLNPRYGRLGLVAFPLLALEDLAGPVLELLGYFLIPIGLVLGVLDPKVAILFFLLTCVFGTIISAGSLLLEEWQLRPTATTRDFARLAAASIIENFGYRQMLQFFRLRGIWHFLKGNKSWAAVPRLGLANSTREDQIHPDRRAEDKTISYRAEIQPLIDGGGPK